MPPRRLSKKGLSRRDSLRKRLIAWNLKESRWRGSKLRKNRRRRLVRKLLKLLLGRPSLRLKGRLRKRRLLRKQSKTD